MKYDPGMLDLIDQITMDQKFCVKFHTGIKINVDRIAVSAGSETHPAAVIPAQFITEFHVTGKPRQRLVQRLAVLTGARPHYLGFPSMAYEVGELVIRKDGCVEGRLSKKLIDGLAKSGFEVDR